MGGKAVSGVFPKCFKKDSFPFKENSMQAITPSLLEQISKMKKKR